MASDIKILIVEDEALIAEKVKIHLEDFGYSVASICYDFESAEKAIRTISFDVMITDINLGYGLSVKNGLQLAHQVNQLKKDCPIIFLTAYGDKDTIRNASSLFPASYLVKPVNAANLYASVQLAIDNYTNRHKTSEAMEDVAHYFFVKLGNNYIKIFWKDVYHLEAIKNYVKIATCDRENEVLISGSLQNVLQNMVPDSFKSKFIKINRAEAIVKDIILSVNKDTIVTTYGEFRLSSSFDRKTLVLR